MRLTSRATQPEGRTPPLARVVLPGRGLLPQRRPAAAEVTQKARTLITASVEPFRWRIGQFHSGTNQLCHSSSSSPRTKTSRRPSALRATIPGTATGGQPAVCSARYGSPRLPAGCQRSQCLWSAGRSACLYHRRDSNGSPVTCCEGRQQWPWSQSLHKPHNGRMAHVVGPGDVSNPGNPANSGFSLRTCAPTACARSRFIVGPATMKRC
jgi:hypothetical protein